MTYCPWVFLELSAKNLKANFDALEPSGICAWLPIAFVVFEI